MKILIGSRSLRLDESLRRHVERRIHFGLGRFAPHIRQVAIRLDDVNGPRGGVDISCHLEVLLRPGGELRIVDLDSDARSGVDRAVDRAAHSVARHVERERETRHHEPAREGGMR